VTAADNPELLDVAARIAEMAGPGEQVEAFVARSTSTTVRAYDGDVESLTQASSAGVGVRVIVDHREGFAYAGTLDEGVVLEALAEARDNATFGEPDEFNGLATPDGVEAADLDLWPEHLADVPTAEKVALALELEAATKARDPRVSSVRLSMFSDALGEGAVATSTGIRAWGRAGTSYLMVQALAVQDGETQIAGGLSVGREVTDLSVDEAADDAVLRATRLLGSTKPATQRLTLVLEPRMTATILGIVGGMLNGEAVLKGRSPFADRVGEAVASPLLTFVDDPTDPRSLGAESHDGEGLARRRNELVRDGVLQGFLHNTYTGRRSGTASTGSAQRGVSSTPGVGASALAVAPGSGTHEEVLAGVEHGLFVTAMAGLHSGVNPVSGDFSVGIEGLMVKGGELAEPIREATIASTIQRLLLDISAVGADLEWLPDGTGGVTLVIPDIALSGA
jgi:PmbA protein